MNNFSQKKIGVSVIVCCYNSQDRLPETIKHLALQEVPVEINWEIIIVNNASSDDTTGTAYREWEKYNSKVSFRVVEQPVPGLSAAREKGIESAQYEYLLFSDDDNWLQKNYVSNAYRIIHNNEEIGALGGVGRAEFEIPPPEWYDSETMQIMLALGEQADANGDISESKGYVYGAGMVLRDSALNHIKLAGFEHKLMGRFKDKLTSGEDDEICYSIRIAGYRIWYNDSLEFKHFIPKERLKWKYFLNLNEMNSRSGVYLSPYLDILKGKKEKKLANNFKWISKVIKSIVAIMGMWKIYRRYLFFGEHHRRAHLRYRRLIGKIKGWLSIRSKYSNIFNYLVDFEKKARSIKQKPSSISSKETIYE